MTIFVIGVIFAKFNGGCVAIFAEVPVVIFTKLRGGVGGVGEFNSATGCGEEKFFANVWCKCYFC